MRLLWVNKNWWSLLVLALVIVPGKTQARVININGNLGLTYNYSQNKAGSVKTSFSGLSQRYNIGGRGRVYRLGNYSLSFTWSDSKSKIENNTTSVRTNTHVNIQNFFASLNLFPKKSPLSVTGQRNVTRNDVDSFESKDTRDLLGVNWVVHRRGYPRTTVNYQRARLESERAGADESSVVAENFTISGDGRIENTSLGAAYQISKVVPENNEKSTSQGFNVHASTSFSPGVNGAAGINYSTSKTPPIHNQPGLNFFQERSAVLTYSYGPPLLWWNANTGYNYSETPFVDGVQVHSVHANLSARPTQRTSFDTGIRASRLTIPDVLNHQGSLSAAASYRPFFGLSTSLNGGLSYSDVESAQDITTLTQGYGYSVGYNKSFPLLQYSAGYTINYNESETLQTNASSRGLNNSITLGLDNSNTRILHIGSSASFNDSRQENSPGSTTGNQSFNFALAGDSNYFKDIFRRGDRVSLGTGYRYSWSAQQSSSGRAAQTFRARGEYLYRRLTAGLSYSREVYQGRSNLDRATIKGNVHWSTVLMRDINLSLSAEDIYEDNRNRVDTNRFEGNVELIFRLGALSFNVSYRKYITNILEGGGRTDTDSYTVTLNRGF